MMQRKNSLRLLWLLSVVLTTAVNGFVANTKSILTTQGTHRLSAATMDTYSSETQQEELLADEEVVAALGVEQIEANFDLGYHTKHVDTIFKRVFG